MKFSQNTPVISPNTIGNVAVRVSGDPMAYGTGGKEYGALAGAIGQMAKVAKEQQDDMDAADHMNRRNNIMTNITKRLYGEDGIMTTGVGINAKGLTDRVQQVVKEEFDNGLKGANNRVRRSMAGTFNENMGNYLRLASQQEGREFTKQKTAQYGISIDNGVNLSMINYENGDILNNNINDLMNIVDYRAKDQGFSEMQRQQERRRVLTAVVGGTMQAAIDNGDLDTASIYADRYGKYMEQGELMKFQKVLRQEKRLVDEKNVANDILSRHLRPDGTYDLKAIDEEIDKMAMEKKTVGGGSNDRFVRIAQKTAALIRQKIPNASPNLEKYLYGQMVHETGHFTHDRALANNNFAGLHGGADGKHYANDDEYIKDYASFFTEGYHGNAVTAESGKEFARRLSQSGWFTDPNVEGYGNNIESSYAEYDQKAAAGGGVSFEKLDSDIDASGVKINGAQPQTIGMINRAKQIYKKLFNRDDFWVSSVTGGHDDGTPHALGYKADVGGSALKESYKNRIKFQQALQAEGIGANNEYDQPSEGSTGPHFDLDSRGKNWQTGEEFGGFKGGGGGHTVNAHDSGWADRVKKIAHAKIADAEQYRKDEKNQKLQNYWQQIQGTNSAEEALDIFNRVNSGEDYQTANAVEAMVKQKYPTIFNTQRSRSSSSSDSGYTGKSGKHYSTRQYEEAKETNRLYRDHVKLQNQGLYKISDDEQERAIKSSRITNDVENAAYDDDGIAAAARAYSENRGDFYGAINTLVEQVGMTQDEASRYISKYLEWHAADED